MSKPAVIIELAELRKIWHEWLNHVDHPSVAGQDVTERFQEECYCTVIKHGTDSKWIRIEFATNEDYTAFLLKKAAWIKEEPGTSGTWVMG